MTTQPLQGDPRGFAEQHALDALRCLYHATDRRVADDVNEKVKAALAESRRECEELKAKLVGANSMLDENEQEAEAEIKRVRLQRDEARTQLAATEARLNELMQDPNTEGSLPWWFHKHNEAKIQLAAMKEYLAFLNDVEGNRVGIIVSHPHMAYSAEDIKARRGTSLQDQQGVAAMYPLVQQLAASEARAVELREALERTDNLARQFLSTIAFTNGRQPIFDGPILTSNETLIARTSELTGKVVVPAAELESLKLRKQWYAELLEVIYGERPEGENERPDPRLVVESLRKDRERLEWLEAHPHEEPWARRWNGPINWFRVACNEIYPSKRAAIDAARAATGEGK